MRVVYELSLCVDMPSNQRGKCTNILLASLFSIQHWARPFQRLFTNLEEN